MPDASPELLSGRYELGATLGLGGMGVVRAGRDLRLGRPVAVKVLDAVVARQPEVRRRFEAEARAAARLSHPNVVAVFDTGEHEGLPYIVMERLPGRTLADEIAEGRLSAERARRVATEILAALEAAHDAGIVHRDVKPANVLLGEGGAAKVADFGIAKSTEGLDLTTTGTLIGTPAYLAPERLSGQPATVQSDLYSVGVVLYEALTGAKPYGGETPLVVAHAIQQAQPLPLEQARSGLDPGLVRTVGRAMQPDPERRFASAAEMAGALSAGPGPEATVAQGPRPAEATMVSARRYPPTAAMPAGDGAPPPPPAPPHRDRGRWVAAGLVLVAVVAALVALALVRGDGGGCDPPPTAATTPTTSSLPGPLADSLDRLQDSVCP